MVIQWFYSKVKFSYKVSMIWRIIAVYQLLLKIKLDFILKMVHTIEVRVSRVKEQKYLCVLIISLSFAEVKLLVLYKIKSIGQTVEIKQSKVYILLSLLICPLLK